jgi:hypothetical protein
MLDDKILDKTDLDKFIPVKKESNSQDINNAVLFRTISLENICTIEVL